MAAKPGHRPPKPRRDEGSAIECAGQSSASSFAARPRRATTRSQNITCDRTALGCLMGPLDGADFVGEAGRSGRKTRRWPSRRSRRAAVFDRSQQHEAPIVLEASQPSSRGSTSASILSSRNCSSYWPSPRPRSHRADIHRRASTWLGRMIVQPAAMAMSTNP